jgi:Protein of unknown function (DUF3048) N-terminal domain/Protein of unknown function (DUF3048) C-terminal domain
LGVLAACSIGQDPTAPVSSAPAPPVSPVPSLAPTIEPEPTTSPLSGRDGGVDTPVVVVKLDNTPHAQPHRGLVDADMVYVEPVEWGLTRLAAVFSTDLPAVAGPVRSARISDITLFAPFGDIAFVYSGAQQRLHPRLASAAWTEVSPDVGSAGFHREYGTGRVAPWNLMADPRSIARTSGATATAPDLGLDFSAERPSGGERARTVTARWDESTVQFRWNKAQDAYDVWFDGRQARDTAKPGVQRATTVLVQYVKEVDSGYGDKFGGRTPLTILQGSGKGLMLRDGRAWRITWSKPTKKAPTAYLDAAGQPVELAPGQVWIVLKDRTRKVSVE